MSRKEKQMKKLFVSVPMKGLTDEQIKKEICAMHKIAELYFGEELEVIETMEHKDIPDWVLDKDREAVWMLGESIQRMCQADYYIGVDDLTWFYSGCRIENAAAEKLGVPRYLIPIYKDSFLYDAWEVYDKTRVNDCAYDPQLTCCNG